MKTSEPTSFSLFKKWSSTTAQLFPIPRAISSFNFAFPDIGTTLFGEDVLNDVRRLLPSFTSPISIIARHVHASVKGKAARTLVCIEEAEQEVANLVDGMSYTILGLYPDTDSLL